MRKIHYAWVVCLASTIIMLVTAGLTINAFAVYQPFIMKVNGFTNTQTSSMIMMRNCSSFLAMILVRMLYQRFSMRTGMIFSGVLVVFAFILFGFAGSYLLYLIAFAIMGLGFGFGAIVGAAMIFNRWFHTRRSLAYGLCASATGLSSLGTTSLLTWSVETFGLSRTFFYEAACIAVLVIVAGLLLRNDPAELGLEPYGSGDEVMQKEKRDTGVRFERRDWLLMIPILLLLSAGTNSGYAHLSVLFTDFGYSPAIVARGITLIGMTLVASKIFCGWMADRVPRRISNWIFGGLLAMGSLICCFADLSRLLIYPGLLIYGFGMPLANVGLTVWAGDLSAPDQYDDNVRIFQIFNTIGAMAFAIVPGILADRWNGSYKPAYLLFTGTSVLMTLGIQYLYRRKGICD